MPDKVLVIGGSGLVGNALVRAWGRRGIEVAATAWSSSHGKNFLSLDIRDDAAVRGLLHQLRPGVVALPAANPYVDYCETHPKETRLVNVIGSLNAARACRSLEIPMIFYSSDYVFDGSRGFYDEEEKTSPLNEYGRQKVEVEEQVLAMSPRNLVLRTSGAYGWQWNPKNFVLQVLSRLRAGEAMRVPSDFRSNPTYVENLAEISVELALRGAGGLFHIAGADSVGRYDFALEIAKVFALDAKLLSPISGRDMVVAAKRPQESVLASRRLKDFAGLCVWGIRQGLEHMRSLEESWRRYAGSDGVVERSG